jgi:hypothetical protein
MELIECPAAVVEGTCRRARSANATVMVRNIRRIARLRGSWDISTPYSSKHERVVLFM